MKQIFTIVFTFIIHIVLGQNLVPNPSFEDYTNCPINFSALHFPSNGISPTYVNEWYRANFATSDYYNICNTTNVSVPHNIMGYQQPRTGNAYCGLFAFHATNNEYAEYIETKLKQNMIPGNKYFVAYSVNLAVNGNFSNLACDKLGVLFTEDSVEISTYSKLYSYHTPQLQSPNGVIYSDTLNWTTIFSLYTANGNERWMTLGAFSPNANVDTLTISSIGQRNAYYYYDDICVLDIDGEPYSTSVLNIDLCNKLINQIEGRNGMLLYIWNDNDTSQTKSTVDAGTYWVKSIDYNNCIFHVDTFHLTRYSEEIEIDFGADTILCPGKSIELNAFHNNFAKYEWSTGDSSSSIIVTTPGTYYVYASSMCYYGSDTIQIEGVPLPQAILPNDTTLCNGIETLYLSYHQDYMSNIWSTGAKDTCCIIVDSPGTYSLTVVNECNEMTSASINVDYINCNNCLWVPNAFSPNGDGINDVFKPETFCWFNSYKFKIFNRFGELIYSTEDINASWNGMYNNGTPAELGVYFYYIEADPILDRVKTIRKRGDITLLR